MCATSEKYGNALTMSTLLFHTFQYWLATFFSETVGGLLTYSRLLGGCSHILDCRGVTHIF